MAGDTIPPPYLVSVPFATLVRGMAEAASMCAVQMRLYAPADIGYSSATTGEASRS